MSDHFTAPMEDEQKTSKIALIDADYLKYLVASDIAKEKKQGFVMDERLIINLIQIRLDDIMPHLDCKARVYLFSGKSKDTFRYHLAREKEYKGNRKAREEEYEGMYDDMEFVKKYIIESEKSIYFDDLEADDLLGMLQDKDTFIFSKDKDSKTIPGHHWSSDHNEIIYVHEHEAWRTLMYQVLGGDSGDNILGLRGFGLDRWEKGELVKGKVNKLLDPIEDGKLLGKVMMTYMEKLGKAQGLDAFVENYSLVRLTLNRGPWLQKKYQSAYTLINLLKLVK